MARATFVKKARKNVQGTNIKKGEAYYWWKFRHGGKQYSKTAPRASQLTQSEFLSTIYSIQEEMDDLTTDNDNLEDFVQDIKDRLQELADETQEKKDNMPDSLQEGPTGELLQERVDGVEEMISELDGIAFDNEFDPDSDDAEKFQDRQQEIIDEIQCITYSGS